MGARRRLIVVSNRGPVTFGTAPDGSRVARRGGGGLVTALRALVAHHEVTWVASALSDEDRAAAGEQPRGWDEQGADGSPFRLRLVAHDPAAYERFYHVVSNPMLWFVHHYLWALGSTPEVGEAFHEAWGAGYAPVNGAFADAVCEELERDPGAAVFFHDYHLYLAPAMVRARCAGAAIAHVVHVPWPQPDAWRVLPRPVRAAVHEGLLAADLVCLHTDRWRRNFLHGCEEIAGARTDPGSGRIYIGSRCVSARVAPISVDPAEFEGLALDERVLAHEERIAATRPEHLVLRVDRTDPSKNIVRGFHAFERVLERRPDLHGRITMLALLDPSRQELPEYARYLDEIHETARRVNGRFARDGWVAVDLRVEDDFLASVAAYKQYDILLVNAIFDGMNLVAKEAPLVNTRDGVLVLSENAGAHAELAPWSIGVNPFDIEAQADAIEAALRMPREERREWLTAIRGHVSEHDAGAWIAALLRHLDEAIEQRGSTIPA